MLTRLIKNQLAIFAILSVIGVAAMVFSYIQVPTLLGLGRVEVRLELPTSGGLYRFSNVTYRGVQVGKITDIRITKTGAEATMSIATSPKIPADLEAEVRSVSAVGEQYVDLRPRTASGPYLEDGAVITAENISLPTAVGPVLDRVSKLVDSIPKGKLSALLDETYKGFNGAGYDFGSLLDSGSKLSSDLNGVADQTRTLADDSRPLLEGQAATGDAIRTWARSLAGFTGQVAASDPQLRTVLQTFPGFSNEVSGLLNQIKPTLPVLLANLGTVSEILMTYNASLEQLLVLLPPYFAQQQSYTPLSDSTGNARGDFGVTVDDPPACTVGFLPQSQWRSPDDLSDIDTPDGLYCKLPQDSPLAVRGVRNFPCIRKPGKRAPTVQICNSDKPFVPLSMRQHALGPAPFDPSLIAQGIPPDDRVNLNESLSGPMAGTPLPPGVVPSATPPSAAPPGGPPLSPLEAPLATVPPPPGDTAVPVAPSAFKATTPGGGPTVAFAQYNPRTGEYVGSDGKLYRVTNLAADAPLVKSWKDMLPH
jgi:virulence factor Mce-like protein